MFAFAGRQGTVVLDIGDRMTARMLVGWMIAGERAEANNQGVRSEGVE